MSSINPRTVCYIIVKARAFDAKVAPAEPDPGSNPSLCGIGRGDYDKETWDDARAQATDLPLTDRPRYLLGPPLLGVYLEEGLAALGYSCEEYEIGRL